MNSNMRKAAESCFFGIYYQKTPPKRVSGQNTPFWNSFTTQLIHKNSNSIEAAQQVQHQTKLKHVENLSLAKQF
jgi:hypothetical protein